jgi:uncharacterized protein
VKTIVLEEHYATAAFMDGPGWWLASRPMLPDALLDLGDGRIAARDFLDSLDLADVDRARVTQLNAEKLLGLDGPDKQGVSSADR